MKEEKSALESILNTIGQIIGVIIIWFMVGAGWNGIHDWFNRSILRRVPGEDSGERFGKMVFYGWVASFILLFYLLANVDQELGGSIIIGYLRLTLLFIIITLIGLVYFFKNLNK